MQRILQDIKRRYHTPDINNTFTHREEVQESVYVNRDQTNLWTNTKHGAAGEQALPCLPSPYSTL